MLHKQYCDNCQQEWAVTLSFLLTADGQSEDTEEEIFDRTMNKHEWSWVQDGRCYCPGTYLPENREFIFIFDMPPPLCPFQDEHLVKMKQIMGSRED